MDGCETFIKGMEAELTFEQGKRAAQSGAHGDAEQWLEQVVAAEPTHLEAWLWLSSVSEDNAKALERLQHAAQLAPHDPRVQYALQRAMLHVLERDAFIAYLSESSETYTIALRSVQPIVVSKARGLPEVFPLPSLTEGQQVLRLVSWMVVGLIPAGLGTVLMLPYMLWRSLRLLLARGLDPVEGRRAQLAVSLTLGLGLASGLLCALLLLHLLA